MWLPLASDAAWSMWGWEGRRCLECMKDSMMKGLSQIIIFDETITSHRTSSTFSQQAPLSYLPAYLPQVPSSRTRPRDQSWMKIRGPCPYPDREVARDANRTRVLEAQDSARMLLWANKKKPAGNFSDLFEQPSMDTSTAGQLHRSSQCQGNLYLCIVGNEAERHPTNQSNEVDITENDQLLREKTTEMFNPAEKPSESRANSSATRRWTQSWSPHPRCGQEGEENLERQQVRSSQWGHRLPPPGWYEGTDPAVLIERRIKQSRAEEEWGNQESNHSRLYISTYAIDSAFKKTSVVNQATTVKTTTVFNHP